MTLSNLQTSNHHFTIAAFDHRGSLTKLLGLDEGNTGELTRQMIELKQIFLDILGPLASGVLTDPIYGRQTLNESFNDNSQRLGVLLSLEESSYEGDKGVVPKLVENWGIAGVNGYDAAAKLLLYYHPHEPNAESKLDLVRNLFAEAQKLQTPFLLEPVIHRLESESETEFKQHWVEYQQQLVEQFDTACDVLKLEYPGLYASSAEEARVLCQKISQIAGEVPWIILSRGMKYDKFKAALEVSMQAGAAGFAVGRAVWQEIDQFSVQKTGSWEQTKQEIINFLRTTGVERFQTLVSIVESG